MCGIAGQVRLDRTVDQGLIERMCAAMEHRGPDSRGTFIDEGVGLGIQRLRIIDLETGDQPIYNEDRTVVVVLNGEIYNHRELRRELEAEGHRFATHGDTEVIVHLYEREGVDCVKHLHGMFAFALWDTKERRLLVARDRIGKKPLYYALRDGTLSFASELGALLQDPDLPREPDHQALDAYLAYRWVPAPRTAFRGVRKLLPGHFMLFRCGELTEHRYWRLDFGTKRQFAGEAELHEAIRAQLRAATTRRLDADVPVGAFLSGGVDSAAVVAAMSETSSHAVRTFSIGFDSDEYNELPLARIVAERFATEHHEFVVRPDAVEVIPRIVRHYGEPFADASSIPSFYVAEIARRHVTVALNGDGGDETFAGYPRYVVNQALQRLERMPRWMRALAGRASALVPESGRIDSWQSRAHRVLSSAALDPAGRYIAYMTHLNGLSRDELYTAEYRELVGDSMVEGVMRDPWENGTAHAPLDRMLEVDSTTYLPDDLLTKMDIAT